MLIDDREFPGKDPPDIDVAGVGLKALVIAKNLHHQNEVAHTWHLPRSVSRCTFQASAIVQSVHLRGGGRGHGRQQQGVADAMLGNVGA